MYIYIYAIFQNVSPTPSSSNVWERIGERGLRTREGGGAARHHAADAGAVVIFEGMACAGSVMEMFHREFGEWNVRYSMYMYM